MLSTPLHFSHNSCSVSTELPHHQLLCVNRGNSPHHIHELRPHSLSPLLFYYYRVCKKVCQGKNTQKKIIFEGNRVCLENKGGGIKRREPSAFIDYIFDSKNNAPHKKHKGREGNRTPQWYWPIIARYVRYEHPPDRVFHKRESIRPLSCSAVYESPFVILSKFITSTLLSSNQSYPQTYSWLLRRKPQKHHS